MKSLTEISEESNTAISAVHIDDLLWYARKQGTRELSVTVEQMHIIWQFAIANTKNSDWFKEGTVDKLCGVKLELV